MENENEEVQSKLQNYIDLFWAITRILAGLVGAFCGGWCLGHYWGSLVK